MNKMIEPAISFKVLKVQIHNLISPKEQMNYMKQIIRYSKVEFNGGLIGWVNV